MERRERRVTSDPDCLDYLSAGREWPNLRPVVRVTGQRETAAGVTVQPRCYISSLEAPAGRLLEAVRSHWSIENSLHWSLDATFGEDQCLVCKDNGPQNMATLRRISHNLMKRETSLKAGIQSLPPATTGGQTPPIRMAGRLPAKRPPQLKRDCPGSRLKGPHSPTPNTSPED